MGFWVSGGQCLWTRGGWTKAGLRGAGAGGWGLGIGDRGAERWPMRGQDLGWSLGARASGKSRHWDEEGILVRSWAGLMDSWHVRLSSCLAPESNVKTLLFFPLGNVASFMCLLKYFGSPAAHSVSMAGIPCPHVGVPCAQCSAGWVDGAPQEACLYVGGR